MEGKSYLSFLEKYAQNRHTDAEHQDFLAWFETLPEEEAQYVMDQYVRIAGQRFAGQRIAGHADGMLPAERDLVRKIESRLDLADMQKAGRYAWWKGTWKYAAAAVILLAAYWGFERYDRAAPSVDTIADARAHEIAPGKNRAVLTLTDGSSVVLNDIEEGEIAKQAGVVVRKTGDDQLVYGPVAEGQPGQDPDARAGNLFNTITIPKAGQYQVRLPDGTRVWLNSSSSLRFPVVFDQRERRVEISGEAYFEVAKVAGELPGSPRNLPFVVISNNQIVEVTGTRFNVNSYHDEHSDKTTLLEGGVRVSVRQTGQTVSLKPGEQSVLQLAVDDSPSGKSAAASPVVTVMRADVEGAVAWKDGYFRFRDTGIEEVMRQLARWYDIEVEYKGPVPADYFTGFVSRNVKIDNVLRMLGQGGDVAFSVSGRKVVVTTADAPVTE